MNASSVEPGIFAARFAAASLLPASATRAAQPGGMGPNRASGSPARPIARPMLIASTPSAFRSFRSRRAAAAMATNSPCRTAKGVSSIPYAVMILPSGPRSPYRFPFGLSRWIIMPSSATLRSSFFSALSDMPSSSASVRFDGHATGRFPGSQSPWLVSRTNLATRAYAWAGKPSRGAASPKAFR